MLIIRAENKKDPKAPEIVLLGLILVNLGPLKIFPIIKPPMSEAIQPKSKINNIILRWTMLEKEKNNKQKINTNIIKIEFWINFTNLFLFNFSTILKNSIIDKTPNVIKKNNSKKLNLIINETINSKANAV